MQGLSMFLKRAGFLIKFIEIVCFTELFYVYITNFHIKTCHKSDSKNTNRNYEDIIFQNLLNASVALI